jgi:hypothetical protein
MNENRKLNQNDKGLKKDIPIQLGGFTKAFSGQPLS